MVRNLITRKILAFGAALATLAVAFVAGTGATATATQGQAVIAGADNSASNSTKDYNTAGWTAQTCLAGGGGTGGLVGCGSIGVDGTGDNYGVSGLARSTGIAGVLGQGPTGVFGLASGPSDTGVVGSGGAVGVYGQGSLSGVEA